MDFCVICVHDVATLYVGISYEGYQGPMLSIFFTLFSFLAEDSLFLLKKASRLVILGIHLWYRINKGTVLMMILLGRVYLVKMREDRLILTSFLRFDSPRLSYCVNKFDD